MYSLLRTVDPTSEPVTLDQVKQQCRLAPNDFSQDLLLSLYIKTAREYVEEETGRALLQQTWVLTRDSFPGVPWGYGAPGAGGMPGSGSGAPWVPSANVGWPAQFLSKPLLLPRGRLIGAPAITYYDTSNTQQTLDPELYVFDPNAIPARVSPTFGAWWPTTAWRIGAVQITYQAGYGTTAAAVPGSLQLAILMLVGHFYENREATQAALSGNGPLPLPLGVADLLAAFTVTALTLET